MSAPIPAAPPPAPYRIIGRSPAIKAVLQLVARVAAANATALVTGESGTGKELVARALHEGSPRARRSFVAVNCGAIPEALIESELFGHEQGAFTGAVKTHVGKFQRADGGTIFLDEIGELPLMLQAKLLRVLQEREIDRLGGATYRVDVRIVAATNRDLAAEVKAGRFRADLYYRLNVIGIHVPALRERKEDIPALVSGFVLRLNSKRKRPIAGVDADALATLAGYHWPGNVRELENVIERAAALADGDEIHLSDLPSWLTPRRAAKRARFAESIRAVPDEPLPPLETAGLKATMRALRRQIQRRAIAQALEEAGGVTQAARQLGVSRKLVQLVMVETGMRKHEPIAQEGCER